MMLQGSTNDGWKDRRTDGGIDGWIMNRQMNRLEDEPKWSQVKFSFLFP